MIRTLDGNIFNKIANHPDVRPFLGGNGPLDFTTFCEDIKNFCLLTDNGDGGYMVESMGNGFYKVHTLALKSARGRPMVDLMAEGFKYLFTATDCTELSTYVPDGSIAAKRFTELAKFKPTYRRENCYIMGDNTVGLQFYTMTYQDWLLNSDECQITGQKFHQFIEANLDHENHPEDEVHDKFVGATMMCCEEGNSVKGIALYNKWAALSGYEPAQILCLNPLTINIDTAILEQSKSGMDVLKLL